MYDSFKVREHNPFKQYTWRFINRDQRSIGLLAVRWCFDDKTKVIDGKTITSQCFHFMKNGKVVFVTHVWPKKYDLEASY